MKFTTRPSLATILRYIRNYRVIVGHQWPTLAEDDICQSALSAGFIRVQSGFYEVALSGISYLEMQE